MSCSRAAALCIPEGTHFLCEGSDSNFPTRFHNPSSSKGVKWSFTPGPLGGEGASLSSLSSLAWPFSTSQPKLSCFKPVYQREREFNLFVLITSKSVWMWCVVNVLTNAQRVFLELRDEVWCVGHAVQITLQHVPAHLIIERIPELSRHLRTTRDHYDFSPQLHYFHKKYTDFPIKFPIIMRKTSHSYYRKAVRKIFLSGHKGLVFIKIRKKKFQYKKYCHDYL